MSSGRRSPTVTGRFSCWRVWERAKPRSSPAASPTSSPRESWSGRASSSCSRSPTKPLTRCSTGRSTGSATPRSTPGSPPTIRCASAFCAKTHRSPGCPRTSVCSTSGTSGCFSWTTSRTCPCTRCARAPSASRSDCCPLCSRSSDAPRMTPYRQKPTRRGWTKREVRSHSTRLVCTTSCATCTLPIRGCSSRRGSWTSAT